VSAARTSTRAKGEMKRLGETLEDPDLAYFVQDTPEFDAYGRAVRTINCHHNFTQRETHDGREVWITRKGAIKADASV
jgi:tRNA-splicing ligase RtcB